MLATLLAAVASGEIIQRVRAARMAVVAYGLAGLALLCGLGFLVGAAYIAAAAAYGSFHAALGFGAGFIIVALAIVIVHRIVVRRRERRLALLRAEQAKTYAGAAALGMLPTLIKSRPGMLGVAVPLMAIAAYAFLRESQRPDEEGGAE